jgi:hypothetical protein
MTSYEQPADSRSESCIVGVGSNNNKSDSENDDNPMVLPVLKYGYRETRLQWHELEKFITVDKDYDRLARSVSQQRDYEFFKCQLQREWNSLLDHVLVTKFGVPRCRNPSTGLWMSAPQMTKPDNSTVTVVLARNDFPYYLENSIEHWILWKWGGTGCNTQDILDAKRQLKEEKKQRVATQEDFGGSPQLQQQPVVEILHWMNPPHLQSLPDISHVHFLCRAVVSSEVAVEYP